MINALEKEPKIIVVGKGANQIANTGRMTITTADNCLTQSGNLNRKLLNFGKKGNPLRILRIDNDKESTERMQKIRNTTNRRESQIFC